MGFASAGGANGRWDDMRLYVRDVAGREVAEVSLTGGDLERYQYDAKGRMTRRIQGYFPGRSVVESRPAIAVAEREWERVEAWLSAVDVGSQPETTSPAEIDRDLGR